MENNGIVRYKGKPCIGSNVVMLPIDDKTIPLPINMPLIIGKLLVINLIIYKILENSTLQPQHLYITTDEEIKEGDWVKLYVKHLNKKWIHQVTKQDLIEYPNFNNEGKKIIASNDKSLKVIMPNNKFPEDGIYMNLPQTSQAFIEAYVKANGVGFDKVLVEVEYNEDTLNEYHKEMESDKIKSVINMAIKMGLSFNEKDNWKDSLDKGIRVFNGAGSQRVLIDTTLEWGDIYSILGDAMIEFGKRTRSIEINNLLKPY